MRGQGGGGLEEGETNPLRMADTQSSSSSSTKMPDILPGNIRVLIFLILIILNGINGVVGFFNRFDYIL